MHDVFNNKAPVTTLASEYTTPRFSQASTNSPYKIREHSRGLSRFLALVLRCGIVFLLIFVHYQNKKFKAAINRQLLDIVLFEDEDVDTLTITYTFKQL